MASFPEPQELHHWTATRPSGRAYIATSTSTTTTMDPHTQQQQQHLQPQSQLNSHSQSFLQSTPTPSNLQQQYQNQTPSHSFSNPPYTNSFVPTPPESVHRTTVANTAANAASASSHNFDSALGVSQSQSQSQQLLQPGRFTEEWDATQRGSSLLDAQRNSDIMQRSNSVNSYNAGDDMHLPIRGNTLKKKNSLRRNGSLKRSSSRRSMRAGSVKSLALQSISDPDEAHSAFHCPVPTSGTPTDILANRFQSWRKILKDLIAYFREIQSHYEQRSKSLLKLANVSNNISTPPGFLVSAGINDALQFIRSYNKAAILEANKAKEIEEDVVLALTGLRSDLQQKIKEIKNLSGDFKNTVEKEMDHTRKAVRGLGDVLGRNEMDESLTTGKSDPYLLRLAVDRQIERQLDEENYLHQAYLNLESSGRELESIVVGEIQKAYNAYAGILKREADNSYNLIAELRDGPVSMPKDQEWIHFVTHDSQFVDPNIPLRTPDQIHYPGQDHEAAQEIRAGLLERKSKYLKSYTAGWYVLSSTHLHEFKSADKVQAPVMSLYLPEQKLGSHSSEGGSSNKFIVKGRQTGSMHRGHTWVFRAESHDTMMAWYEDIKALTEKTPEERSQFVRSHSRSLSRSSRRSTNSDELLDDEDEEPFTAEPQVYTNAGPKDPDQTSRRSQAGGRFPSDIQVNAQRGLQAPHSPSSVSSGFQDHRTQPGALATSGALPATVLAAGALGNLGNQESHSGFGNPDRSPSQDLPVGASFAGQHVAYDAGNSYTTEPLQHNTTVNQYQTGGDYFVPVVVPQKRGEPSPGAIANDEHQPPASSTNPAGEHRRDYGVLDEFESTTSDYPSGGKQPNGGTSADANVMILDAEGFPRLDPITRMDHADVPDAESPLTSIGDSTIDEPAPVRPSNNNTRNESAQTISNLHIPGQYPKGTFV